MNRPAYEMNCDGIVGPTHNYSGLAYGNVASWKHKKMESHPREAALQGLEKMKLLADFGIPQAVIPPLERPDISALRGLGFTGTDVEILMRAQKQAPELFVACCSASSMWAANAATVSPSADTADHRVHFTPANLTSTFHRSLESRLTSKYLQALFPSPNHFVHHRPLPFGSALSDEGAANHTRFCSTYGSPGVEFFVYGKSTFHKELPRPHKFPPRHSFEASSTIARTHQLHEDHVVFAQQNPEAIDRGVFHNDVISVGNCLVFFYHELAFINTQEVIAELKRKVEMVCQQEMVLIEVKDSEISLHDAVATYLFNSQLISLPEGGMALIAPKECQRDPKAHAYLDHLIHSKHTPIVKIHYIDLRQSMQNGGGPACLRLRVALTKEELENIHTPALLTTPLYKRLVEWVNNHYREHLTPFDLSDPALLLEGHVALDELTQILKLGSFYPFQKEG